MSEGNVQLKLQVGFDLVAFRKDLGKLANVAQSEFTASLNLKFNRATLDAELNNVQRAISRRVFRAELTTNFEAEIAYADTLERKLKNLSAQRVKNLASVAATGQAGGFIDESKFNAYLNRLTKAPLEAVRNALQSAGVQMKSAGKNTTEELRQSILSGLPQVTEDIGRGLIKGLNPEMKESGRKGAQSLIDGFKKATGIASPSRVFKQLGKFSADGLEIGFFNGLRSFGARSVAEIRRIAALMRLELASIGNVPIAASLPRAGGTRGSRQYFNPIGPLPRGSSDPWAWNQEAFRYDPRLAQPGQARGAGVRPMQARFPFASIPPLMGTTTSPSMFGVSRPALPPAGMSSAEDARRAVFEAREAVARARSAERGAAVMRESAIFSRVSGQVPLGGSTPMLPPGGGTTFGMGGFGGGGPVPPGGFPVEATFAPGGPGKSKGQEVFSRLSGSLQDADQYLKQTRVPLAGAIEGLASEFASATKQVLLYGTAYKALAFFMDLPNQALSAATALQTFRNQLNAVTGSSENASRSFAFIDGLADRFAVPLESVRQGFVRMYASMEPAGFGAAEIEGLFTGVSKAAATFGMSKDQVDRVTYALSQMASKGQIMAEELRGQLGDVLPGSFALFAEAAQMSIPEFTKAMEQGRFSGEAMRAVLNNVAILLNTKFASGAEGAAKTLQGALNTMGTGLQRMYESFEPLVNEVAQKVFPLIASAVSDATIAIKAFTSAVQGNQTAANALSGNARSIYDAMQGVAEIGKAIGSIFMQLLPTFELVGKAFLFVAQQIARFINTELGGWFASVTVQALLLNTVLVKFVQLLGLNLLPVLVAAIAKLRIFTASVIAVAAAKGKAAAATVAFTGALKLLLIPLLKFAAPVAIVAGIMAIADAFNKAAGRATALREQSIAAAQAIRIMSLEEVRRKQSDLRSDVSIVEGVLARRDRQEQAARQASPGGTVRPMTSIEVSKREQDAIERLGLKRKGILGGVFGTGELQSLAATTRGLIKETRVREGEIRDQEQQASQALTAIPPAPSDLTGGAGAGAGAADDAARELERLRNQQQQMILASAELQAKLQEIEFNEGKDIAEEKFNFVKRLIDAEYDYRLSKANEIQAVQLRLEKQLSDSRLSALESVENALMRIEEARFRSKIAGQKVEAAKQFDALQEQQPSAVPGALPGAPDAPVLPLPSGGGQSFQPSSKARALMAAAQTLGVSPLDLATIIGFETGGSYSPSQWGGEGGNYMGLIQFGGPERRQYGANANQSFEEQVQGPVVRYFQDRFRGVGMSTQGATLEDLYTTVLAGNPRANRNARDSFGTSPRSGVAAMGAHRQRALQMFFGGSMANVGAVGPMSGPAFSVEKRSQKAEDEQVVAQREEDAVRTVALLRLNHELQASIKQSRAEIAEAVGAALPISQLELENQLLEQRNALVLQGASEEQIELEQNKAIAQSKSASVQEALRKAISEAESGLKSYDKRLADGAITQEVYDIAITGINDRLKMLRESLGEIDPALERYNAQLLRAKEINDSMEPQLRIATALNEARKEMKSLLDPSQQLITVASGIGNAFGDAFKGLVSGASSARETMANFFQSISNVFTDMLARIIAEWAKIQLIQGLSGFLPGLGSFAGGAGFGGPVLLPTGADIGAGGGILQNAQGQGFGTLGPNFGFRQFATGGIVKGPTLGLVGEGRFNEAVVPLPDGKSIPVELGKDGGNQIISNITITINDGKAQSSSSGGGSSEFGKRMESAVKQVIVNELRPGGVLSGRR
jgi:tape measure domain-containing protein